MRDGEVVQSGKYEELVELGLDFGALVDAHNQSLEIAEPKEVTSKISDGINDEESSVSKSLAGFPLSFSPPVSHPPASPLPAPGQPLSGNSQSLEQKQSNENLRQKSSSISLGEAKDSAAESKGLVSLSCQCWDLQYSFKFLFRDPMHEWTKVESRSQSDM